MRTMWRIFSGFFKWGWCLLNFIREFILNIFLIMLILVGVGIYTQFKTPPPETAKGALMLNITGVVVDKPSVNNKLRQFGREFFGVSANRNQENSLFDVIDVIRQAKNDRNISGMVMDLSDFVGADQPSLQYIGKALREFRDAGKPIYAVGDNYDQPQYYLSSYANKIFLTPQGGIDLHGFATNNLYYKTLLDKLKVTTHIFRVGTYKSAVEPYIRDDMSPAARDADARWVNGLWQNYLATVAANRKITPQQLFPGAEGLLTALRAADGDTARYALDNKLVDEVASRTVIEQKLIKTFGWDAKNKNFNYTSLYDYTLSDPQPDNNQIAVIFANGMIVDGNEAPGYVGGNTTAGQIRDARLDPKVKAIILRVNSPGGSVTASEKIRAELATARQAGKPIVVSMGGMAASGGYWISTPANAIIASPSTLTGSIGIFGVINTVENTLDSVGVHTDGVATSPLADLSMTKALPPEFGQLMQINIERGYKTFLSLVAKSRNKTPQQVDEIAQGHVWIGRDAKANDLVDTLGDFDDAVKKAAELAKLDRHQLVWFEEDEGLIDALFNQVRSSVYAQFPDALQTLIPAPAAELSEMLRAQPSLSNKLTDPQHRYAMCLSCGNVR
ncbi:MULTISPECIES: signal peptide peptidase SppA [Lonsdalea]|uniref:Signal peptide peptidase SppA n=6 Tax=Lonsdalea TaxID=1082702 RepID=A0ACD1JD52_9GAMM|nr:MULTISPECIES: signal peptide peptidase SppA [Lonsdalea]RAT14291.1 signal peptide peptidase SppA [Lonsdalea quercina]RAT20830.1 signal peptide peptidase SppA [Lonsdalea populi]RAT25768.1 signal peptide peptidase SppA [Lonsdalea populi]RAT35421.1 signal peptide peptidase SppA [Lonsdalea populi]RAT68325.1 signal peptide peptidase SppA [Lonsdalea populi]